MPSIVITSLPYFLITPTGVREGAVTLKARFRATFGVAWPIHPMAPALTKQQCNMCHKLLGDSTPHHLVSNRVTPRPLAQHLRRLHIHLYVALSVFFAVWILYALSSAMTFLMERSGGGMVRLVALNSLIVRQPFAPSSVTRAIAPLDSPHLDVT